MTLFATLAAEERRVYIDETSERLNLPPVLVEKDFWVCWTLARIFELPGIGEHIVFKGGTSLSKVFRAIRRFSEDIDLQISCRLLGAEESSFWEEGISRNEGQRRVEALKEKSADYVQSKFMPALEEQVATMLGSPTGGQPWLRYEHEASTDSDVMWFRYPSALPEADEGGYVRRSVKLEPGSLADQRPIGTHTIAPMMADLAPDLFEDFQTEVIALELERTFWEKATILHVEYHRKTEPNIGDRRSRHYSDFAALWNHDRRKAAVADLAMLATVVRNKGLFFKSAWANYDSAKPPTLRLVPPDDRVEALSADYDLMRDFFFDKPPAFDEVVEILREAEREINGG